MHSAYAPWSAADVRRLREVWPDSAVPNSELVTRFGRTLNAIRYKAQILKLGRRPLETSTTHIVALRARRRIEIADLQAYTPEPEGVRETQRLACARELKGRGIAVASIIAGLKLTAIEVATLRGQK